MRNTPWKLLSMSRGSTLSLAVRLYTCGGAVRVSDRVTWSSDTPAVASVDPKSGKVTAVAAGRALISPTGERHSYLGVFSVTVR